MRSALEVQWLEWQGGLGNPLAVELAGPPAIPTTSLGAHTMSDDVLAQILARLTAIEAAMFRMQQDVAAVAKRQCLLGVSGQATNLQNYQMGQAQQMPGPAQR